jgi:MFS family permease
MTALQGAALGFATLLLARAAVGLGEAGSPPAAYSMISDLFAPARRATAFAIYSIVLPIGLAIGVQVAGWGREALGWRSTLQLVGLPGLALALLAWTTLREPTRGYWEDNARAASGSMRKTVGFLLRLRSFRQLLLGQSIATFTFNAGVFDAVYLERSLVFTPVEISRLLGAASTLSIGGMLLGGWIADRLSARGADWPLRCITVFSITYAVSSSAIYLATDGSALTVFYLAGAILPGQLGVVLAAAQALAPPTMRARAAALLLATSFFVGGFGPLVAGTLSDSFAPALGAESMRYALLSVVVPGWLWCALHFWLGSRTLARDLGAQRTIA